MNLRKRAKETLEDVSDASKKVVDSTEWATIALVAVAAVSLLALAVSLGVLSTLSAEHGETARA